MSLNQDQQYRFEDIIQFLNSDEQYMDISGGAGTGKTFLIATVADTILRFVNESSALTEVAITATTNKAAAVIAGAMPHRATDIGTIYSFMNLRMRENFGTGEVTVVPTAKWKIHTNTLIIIDECSMINSALFKYLQKGIDKTCKVLFVGDRNQLAPVKEILSPIYLQGYRTSTLTVPVRNSGQQALMDLCEQTKQTVLTGIFTPIVGVPGVIDLVNGKTVQGILEREFLKEDPARRVISYTNKRVVDYNNHIRGLRAYKKAFEVGEIVSNNSSAELPGKIRLYTDQVFEIVAVESEFMDSGIISGEEIHMFILAIKDVASFVEYKVTVFAEIDDRRQVLAYFKGRKQWDKFFKVTGQFPELRSISASTTHKAQGSTYDSVIVDLADIGKSTNSDQTARLQYVALSRPKSRIFIRGQLPERYFNG